METFKCSKLWDWINKLWFLYTVKCSLIIINGEVALFAVALSSVNKLFSKMKRVLNGVIPSWLKSIYIRTYAEGSIYIKVLTHCFSVSGRMIDVICPIFSSCLCIFLISSAQPRLTASYENIHSYPREIEQKKWMTAHGSLLHYQKGLLRT